MHISMAILRKAFLIKFAAVFNMDEENIDGFIEDLDKQFSDIFDYFVAYYKIDGYSKGCDHGHHFLCNECGDYPTCPHKVSIYRGSKYCDICRQANDNSLIVLNSICESIPLQMK